MIRSYSITLLAAATLGGLATAPARAQTVANAIFDSAPVRSLTTHAVAPGREMIATLREVFGAPVVETFWQNYRLLYPAEGNDTEELDHLPKTAFDATPHSADASLAPPGMETESKVRAIFGAPENELRIAAYTLLEYTELGLRFLFSPLGEYSGAFVIQQEPAVASRASGKLQAQTSTSSAVRTSDRNAGAARGGESVTRNSAATSQHGDYRIRDNALRMIKDSCARK